MSALTDDPPVRFPSPRVPDLKSAIRRARFEDAEQAFVTSDLRRAELSRLDLLREALEPLYHQIPADAQLFELGLVPGDKPRLFVDIIAHVEMDREGKTYRFLQGVRDGRVVLLESPDLDTAVDAVAVYLGRRMVEREKALAGTLVSPPPPVTSPPRPAPVALASSAAAPRRSRAGAVLLGLLAGAVLGAGGLWGLAVLQARGTALPFKLPVALVQPAAP